MPSQFFGLNIAGSGLRNSNAALNATANNISNVQTEGYSRQQVDSQAANALRTFTTYGCAGAGVETLSVERMRDVFFDVKYWNNNSEVGQYEAKAYYMKTMEEYFNDDGITGFTTVFNKMESTLQSITTNSSSSSTKAQFVASAGALTDYFNSVYGNLQELQKDINLEIKQCVDQINSISEQVASLNKQINVIELSGSMANDLRDQRDLLIDRLSEYIDVEVTENPIYDLTDPTRETGGTRTVVKVAGGQILVDASDYSELKCVAREPYEQINQSDVDGLYKITWDNGNEFNLNNASLNGKLKGLVELRDGNNGANFYGKVDTVGTASGGKYDVSIKVDADYLKNLTDCNLPVSGEIKINNGFYSYDDWSFDEATSTYTFTINEDHSACKSAPKAGESTSTQECIRYQGIPYYMTQMTAFVRSFFGAVNNTFEHGVDVNNNQGSKYTDPDGFACASNLFTVQPVTGDQLTQSELNDKAYKGKGGYYFMTAGNVCINEDLEENADLLGTREKIDNGIEECNQVKKVITMMGDKNVYSYRNASAKQMLELVLSDVAVNASAANTYESTYKGLQTSIGNQRTSISGVDEDEEAVSLVKYQNAYTLASKMIQTLTEIYDQLILSTGV